MYEGIFRNHDSTTFVLISSSYLININKYCYFFLGNEDDKRVYRSISKEDWHPKVNKSWVKVVDKSLTTWWDK